MRGNELVGREALYALFFNESRIQGSHCQKVVLHHKAIVFEGLEGLLQALLVGAGNLLA